MDFSTADSRSDHGHRTAFEIAETMVLLRLFVKDCDLRLKRKALLLLATYTNHPLPFVGIQSASLSADLVFTKDLESTDRKEAIRQFTAVVFSVDGLKLPGRDADVLAVNGEFVEIPADEVSAWIEVPLRILFDSLCSELLQRARDLTENDFSTAVLFALRVIDRWIRLGAMLRNRATTFFDSPTFIGLWGCLTSDAVIDEVESLLRTRIAIALGVEARMQINRFPD